MESNEKMESPPPMNTDIEQHAEKSAHLTNDLVDDFSWKDLKVMVKDRKDEEADFDPERLARYRSCWRDAGDYGSQWLG